MTRKIRNTGRTIDVDGRLPALERVLRGVDGLVAVYVYGSYGTRFQTPLSDVDLAVLFADGSDPQGSRLMELIGTITGALREDDVSVLVLNRAPLAMQHRVLARGRRLLVVDGEALADFTERTITRYSDFAIDEQRFFEEYDQALFEEFCHGAG